MRSIILIIGLFARVAPLPAQASASAQEHAERAADFARQGDLKSAESELRKALGLSPNDPELLTSLGGILAMQGQLGQANVYLAQAVRLDPANAVLRRNLAANQWQLSRLKEAHENLDRLLRADPQDKIAIFLLGMVSEREKDYAHSIALLESIPEIAERQPEAFVALASSYYHKNRPEDAQSALKKILSRPAPAQVTFMGGRVALDARDYPLAEALFSAIRSTYPDNAAVESQIALAQYRQGHAAESERTLVEAVEARRVNKETYVLLCKVLADRGAYERALQMAKDAAKEFPDSYDILSTKGAMEMKLQYFSEAVTSLEKAAAIHPSPEATREVALAEWRAGDRKRAISILEQGIRRFPHDAETYQEYGTLLLEDAAPENKAHAVELLKHAMSIDDSLVEARYQLANTELSDGKPDLSIQYLESAIKLDSNDARLHFAMSRAYRRLGRDSDADKEMKAYQKLKAVEQARTGAVPGSQR